MGERRDRNSVGEVGGGQYPATSERMYSQKAYLAGDKQFSKRFWVRRPGLRLLQNENLHINLGLQRLQRYAVEVRQRYSEKEGTIFWRNWRNSIWQASYQTGYRPKLNLSGKCSKQLRRQSWRTVKRAHNPAAVIPPWKKKTERKPTRSLSVVSLLLFPC